MTELRVCPTGCGQYRTKSYNLGEKKTFDGRKCSNCGFIMIQGVDMKSTFKKAKNV